MSAQTTGWSFGSKAWNEYYGLDRGSRRKGDRAQRAGEGLRHALTQAGDREHLAQREADLRAEAEALATWDAEVERLAMAEAEERGQVATWNQRRVNAAVKVRPLRPLPESLVTGLLCNGFKWSERKGGMYWAPRTPTTEAVARLVCEEQK